MQVISVRTSGADLFPEIGSCWLLLFSQHPDHLYKTFHISLVEGCDDDRFFAAGGGVDEADAGAVIGHYHADMAHRADMAIGACKKYQVAGMCLFKGYFAALVGEVNRGAGHADAEVTKHIVDKAGAVETRRG